MKKAHIHFRTTIDEREKLIAVTPSVSLSEAIRQAIALYIQAKGS